jgi:hypothetical protein
MLSNGLTHPIIPIAESPGVGSKVRFFLGFVFGNTGDLTQGLTT